MINIYSFLVYIIIMVFYYLISSAGWSEAEYSSYLLLHALNYYSFANRIGRNQYMKWTTSSMSGAMRYCDYHLPTLNSMPLSRYGGV